MLDPLTVESREYQIKQDMYESEFNLIVIYFIKLEESKRRKEKHRHIHLQFAFANLNLHQRCQVISIYIGIESM